MSAPPSDEWVHVGKHALCFEPPDIVHLRPTGDVSVSDSLALMKFVNELPFGENSIFSLVDMSKSGRQDPAVAKLPESTDYMKKYRAQVFYNATFTHRTLIGIFVRVGKVLKPGALQGPVEIFATEAEARAWINQHREKTAPTP